MSVLDDILKGISPVMGAYREGAWKELRELRKDQERFEYITDGRALLKDCTGKDGEQVGYTVGDLDTEEFVGNGKTKRAAIDDAMEAES